MKRLLGPAALLGFIATVWAANYAVERWGIVSVGFGLSAPAGVYFAGLAFSLRDLVHDQLGRIAVIGAILAGALLSYAISPSLAEASAVAFLLSETADLIVYTPLARKGWLPAVAASNTVGAIIDSAVFLWIAFGSLAFLRGQVVGKLEMTLLAILVIAALGKARTPAEA